MSTLRQLLETISLRIEKLGDAIKQHTDAIYAAEERHRNGDLPIHKVKAVVSYNEETIRNEKAEYEGQHRIQKSIKNATWAAFWAACMFAVVAILQWCAMQRQLKLTDATLYQLQQQTTLQRQQLVGTQAAVVVVDDPQPAFDDINNTIIVVLKNTRQTDARNVHIHYEIAYMSIPDERTIGKPIVVDKWLPFLGQSRDWDGRTTFVWSPPDFTGNTDKWPGNKTLYVAGEFSYDNGFGDTIPSQKFCYYWLPKYSITGSHNFGGGGGFSSEEDRTCNIRAEITRFNAWKQRAQQPQ